MKPLTIAALGAALTLALAAQSGAATRSVRSIPAGWSTTATQGLALSGALDLGNLSPATRLHVAVALPLSNKGAVNAALSSIYTQGSPNYHHFMTPQSFAATFGASPAAVNAVTNYLQGSGFTNVAVSANRLLVTADAPAAIVQNAFNTSLHVFNLNGNVVYANVSPALVPAQLAPNVLSIVGLNNIGMHTFARPARPETQAKVRARFSSARTLRSIRRRQAVADAPCNGTNAQGICVAAGFTPNAFRTVYDGVNQPFAGGDTVAVFTEGDMTQVVADLRQMEAEEGLRAIPVGVVQMGAGSPSNDPTEWDIDTQASSGIAGDFNTMLLYAGGGLDDWNTTLQFSRFATDDAAIVANASFGECELLAYQDGAMAADDNIFLETVLQGQTVFVASGDSGSNCAVAADPVTGTRVGPPMLSYPASSPYVLAVGGTSLFTNAADGTYYGETAWNFGGGGLSLFEQTNPYQKAFLPTYTTRAVPDMAMAADPNNGGMVTVVNGAHSQWGGTSLASPLAMGSYSRFQSAYRNSLGFAQIELYSVDFMWGGNTVTPPLAQAYNPQMTQQIVGFHDVLLGSNGAYSAAPGYDLTTGIGSFDIQKFFVGVGGWPTSLQPSAVGTYSDSMGAMTYYVYAPPNPTGAPRPLVVALHGCLEAPADFEDGTRWFEDAQANNYVVVMPWHLAGSGSDVNPKGCYEYWSNHYRGSGDPSRIAGIVAQVEASYAIDKTRVYAAGMSSGAAMVTALAADYPDIFAAVASASGTEYQPCVSDNVMECLVDLTTKNASQAPSMAGQAAYGQAKPTHITPEIFFQGDADTVVDPYNLDYAVQQTARYWDGARSNGTFPGSVTSSPQQHFTGQVAGGYAYDVYTAVNGALEWYVIHGMNHRWSGGVVEPASNARDGNNYNDPAGPNATQIFRQFLFQWTLGAQ